MENFESAYQDTEYQVWVQPPLAIRIGQPNARLDQLLSEHAVQTACFITAHNPWSRVLDAADNRRLNQALESEVMARGWKVYPGFGQPLRGDWAGEESFLVLGLEASEAAALGQQFRQNAVVWCTLGLPPRLVWIPQKDSLEQ